MQNSNAAVKTYKELRNLRITESTGYFQKFYESLMETKTSYDFAHLGAENFKFVELNKAIDYVMILLSRIEADRKKIMVASNGGSAGIAMHTLEDYATTGGLRTIDFYGPAMLTCIANDYGYEHVFAKQIEMFAEAGDMLFAISSSGKSPNIIMAAEAAKSRGCVVITFSGFEAVNPLRKMGRVNFYTPSNHYGFVEIAHQTLIHCILDLFIKKKIYEQERETLG